MSTNVPLLAKHRSQMTEGEISFIELMVHASAFGLHLSDHTVQRMQKKGVCEWEALKCLDEGIVTELKANGRATMRDDSGPVPVTVVYALRDRVVVTCWKDSGPVAKSMKPYQWQVNACNFMKQFKAA